MFGGRTEEADALGGEALIVAPEVVRAEKEE